MIIGQPRKKVLITGAAGGIGASLVSELSAVGWGVLGSDHPSKKPADQTRQSCEKWITADLVKISRDYQQLNKFSEAVRCAIGDGNLMGIVHNAALQRVGKFEELKAADWQQTLEINLLAPIQVQNSLPYLGAIMGQLSISAAYTANLRSQVGAYARSKAAIAELTIQAVELGGRVRVNAVEPAAVASKAEASRNHLF